MAINYSLGNYVKFLRGTPTAYQNLSEKDPDTLYFISEHNADRGVLYLGEKLISGSLSSSTSLNDLSDVLIGAGIQAGSLLYYDGTQWINKSLSEILEVIVGNMVGATATTNGESGLVPAPAAGQQGLYLRGDGLWANPTAALDSRVVTLEAQVGTLIDNDINQSVRDIAADEVAKIVDGAPAAFDTLKEIADYLADHPSSGDLTQRLVAIESTLYTNDTGLVDRVEALETGVGDLNTALTNLTTTVNSNESRITTLESNLKWKDFSYTDD